MKKASDFSAGLSAKRFVEKIKAHQSPQEFKKIQRYFKSGAGEYGEGDEFMGVRMGQVFAQAKEFMNMPPDEIEKLLDSPIHEIRIGAVSIMDWQVRSKNTTEERRKVVELFGSARRNDAAHFLALCD